MIVRMTHLSSCQEAVLVKDPEVAVAQTTTWIRSACFADAGRWSQWRLPTRRQERRGSFPNGRHLTAGLNSQTHHNKIKTSIYFFPKKNSLEKHRGQQHTHTHVFEVMHMSVRTLLLLLKVRCAFSRTRAHLVHLCKKQKCREKVIFFQRTKWCKNGPFFHRGKNSSCMKRKKERFSVKSHTSFPPFSNCFTVQTVYNVDSSDYRLKKGKFYNIKIIFVKFPFFNLLHSKPLPFLLSKFCFLIQRFVIYLPKFLWQQVKKPVLELIY